MIADFAVLFMLYMSPPVRAIRALEVLTDQPYAVVQQPVRRAGVQDAGTVREAGFPVYYDGRLLINPRFRYEPYYTPIPWGVYAPLCPRPRR